MPYKDPRSPKALASRKRRAKKYQKTLHGGFLYRYHRMKRRSMNTPGNKDYPFYKGKSSEWLSFSDFKNDMWESFQEHVIQHGIKNTTLDRIDTTKGYSRQNCRWATHWEQGRNRKDNILVTYNGETKCLQDWAEQKGCSRTALYYRIVTKKWDINTAMSKPIMSSSHRKGIQIM